MIYCKINAVGLENLADYIERFGRDNLEPVVIAERLAFEFGCGDHDATPYVEIAGRYTKSGNPMTYTFAPFELDVLETED